MNKKSDACTKETRYSHHDTTSMFTTDEEKCEEDDVKARQAATQIFHLSDHDAIQKQRTAFFKNKQQSSRDLKAQDEASEDRQKIFKIKKKVKVLVPS